MILRPVKVKRHISTNQAYPALRVSVSVPQSAPVSPCAVAGSQNRMKTSEIEKVPYMDNFVLFKGTTYEKTALECPACGEFLYRSVTGIPTKDNPLHIACMACDCHSLAAQSGTLSSRDIETAFEKLEQEVQQERTN